MKALVYTSPYTVHFQPREKPALVAPTDAIVKVQHTTICGTDLHILAGHVPSVQPGRILGHEGVGTIEAIGSAVTGLAIADTVLISCITSCGSCRYCRRAMPSHCLDGGWVLGNTIDGTQAEFVRIPHATSSLYKLPGTVDTRAAVALSDALPTGLECGVLNARVEPGGSVVIVGAGPVGLAALLTARLYSPSLLVVVDIDEARLAAARALGASHTVQSSDPDAVSILKKLTPEGEGFDSVIEAVGLPATFELCQELVAPGGAIANVGVHGEKVELRLDRLWDRNISINMKLVDAITTPRLLRLYETGRLDIGKLLTHSFSFDQAIEAYEVFKAAAKNRALKVVIDF